MQIFLFNLKDMMLFSNSYSISNIIILFDKFFFNFKCLYALRQIRQGKFWKNPMSNFSKLLILGGFSTGSKEALCQTVKPVPFIFVFTCFLFCTTIQTISALFYTFH